MEVKNRFGGRCGYCGQLPVGGRLQLDHIEPVEYGGTDDRSNLMPACFACNNLKSTHGLKQWRIEIGEQVRRARDYSVNFRTAERFGLVEAKPWDGRFYFEKHEQEKGGLTQ